MQAATGEERVEGARWSAIWGYKTSSERPVTKWLVTARVNVSIHHIAPRGSPEAVEDSDHSVHQDFPRSGSSFEKRPCQLPLPV